MDARRFGRSVLRCGLLTSATYGIHVRRALMFAACRDRVHVWL